MRDIRMCAGKAVEVRGRVWRLERPRNDDVGTNREIAIVRELTSGREREVYAEELYDVSEPETLPTVIRREGPPMVKVAGVEMLWGPTLREQIRGSSSWLSL